MVPPFAACLFDSFFNRLIYCATRNQVDELAHQLRAKGLSVLPYHAGLDDVARRRHQRQFVRDDVSIVVATIAFGMGIDKSNVRFIVHHDLPKNIENYYQQIGRSGRDGLRADCLLLFSHGDVSTINYFINQQKPSERKGAYERLNGLLRYAETETCRRRPLLSYFGENYQEAFCNFCDNCLTRDKETIDITIPAQMFLSCVKRTGEIFGAAYIIDVLLGSRQKRILQNRHDKLPTHGIGKDYSRDQWIHFSHQFIRKGLVVKDVEYQGLQLTPEGNGVLKGAPVSGTMQELPVQHIGLQEPKPEYDTQLYALLKAQRKEIAETNNVPPYVIFSDRSLVEMATYFPQSEDSFSIIYGVGKVKLEKYFDVFVPIIRNYCEANQITERDKLVTSRRRAQTHRRADDGLRPRTLQVGEAYNNGQSIDAIVTELGFKKSTILRHLMKYAQAGNDVRTDGILSLSKLPADQQKRVFAAFDEHGTDFLRPVFEALDEEISYDELHILRLYFLVKDSEKKAE